MNEAERLRDILDELSRACLEGQHGAKGALRRFVRAQNAIDLAQILPHVDDDRAASIFDQMENEGQAVLLAETDPHLQALLLMHVGDRGSELLAALEPDDAADVLEAVDETERESILEGLELEDAQEIRELRGYGRETAGGVMTPEFVQVAPEATVADVFEAIRQSPDAETVSVIYVTDEGSLIGVLSIREVLQETPDTKVSDFMTKKVISVQASVDQEEVIRTMETYNLPVLPVVDTQGALKGIVTADDALTVQEAEASEDAMKLAGSSAMPLAHMTVGQRVRARLPWLMVTLGGTVLSSLMIRRLTNEEDVDNVACFIPVVGGMAGNVAMQSAVVMVRGFATGEVSRTRVGRMLWEEILTGLLIGFFTGFAVAVVARVFFNDPQLAVSVGTALLGSSFLAAGTGTLVPTFCERVGIDPAVSAGPFITVLIDLVAISIYLLIAGFLYG